MLQATTVVTEDNLNGVSYTTTDILYALHGVADEAKVYAGSNNNMVLQKSTYWSTGDFFWLRSPYDGNSGYVLVADSGYGIDRVNVVGLLGVKPASNLNLSVVIFASAVSAASSETVVSENIPSGKAMTLRLDGSYTEVGEVEIAIDEPEAEVELALTGETATVTENGDGTITVSYTFPATIKQGTGTLSIENSRFGEDYTVQPETGTNDATIFTAEYKVKDASDDTYTNVKPTAVGDYTARVRILKTVLQKSSSLPKMVLRYMKYQKKQESYRCRYCKTD